MIIVCKNVWRKATGHFESVIRVVLAEDSAKMKFRPTGRTAVATIVSDNVSKKRVRFADENEYFVHICRTDYPLGMVWWTKKDTRQRRHRILLEREISRVLEFKLMFIRMQKDARMHG